MVFIDVSINFLLDKRFLTTLFFFLCFFSIVFFLKYRITKLETKTKSRK